MSEKKALLNTDCHYEFESYHDFSFWSPGNVLSLFVLLEGLFQHVA